MAARLRVDRTMCVGSGLCEAMAPELFTLAADGLAEPAEPAAARLVDPARIELARDIADCCPSGAIVLDPDHSIEQEGAGR